MGKRTIFMAIYMLLMLSTVSFVACSTASTSASQHLDEDGPRQGRLRLRGPLLFFQILMNNPFGTTELTRPCSRLGGTCDATIGATSGCCNYLQCTVITQNRRVNAIEGTCCIGNENSCGANGDCCSGYCCFGDPRYCNGTSSDPGVCKASAPCFAGGTLIHVKDKSEPVEIQNVETGDEILCLGSNDDLREPQALEWCEVMNWAHAETSSTLYYSINYQRPSGGRASLTISPFHLFTKLVGPSVKVGDTASSMDGFGPFESLRGEEVQKGDLMAVLVDWSNPASSLLQVVEVESVNVVRAGGMYLPATKNAWIIADGVAVPRVVELRVPMVDANSQPVTLEGAKEAMVQYHTAAGWMNRIQARGVAGKDSYWNTTVNGITVTTPLMPSSSRVFAASMQHVRRGEVLNFTKLQEWFLPKLQDWQTNNSNTLDAAEIVAALNSPGMFVNVTAQPVRRWWDSQWDSQ